MKYIYIPFITAILFSSCTNNNTQNTNIQSAAATISQAEANAIAKDDSMTQLNVATIEPVQKEVVEQKKPRKKPSPAAQAKEKTSTKKSENTVVVEKTTAKSAPVKEIGETVNLNKNEGSGSYSKKQILFIENFPVWKLDGTKIPLIAFKAKMAIDADGSPRAYGPNNSGLDDISNAGRAGNWYGVATGANGQPIVQSASDPNPGYYVSTTALFNASFPKENPRRYVNSEEVPYISLPKALFEQGVELGDMAYVYNTATKKACFAIVADRGPSDMLGEGSIYLAKQLGVRSNPKDGGESSGKIMYLVFPQSGSGNGKHKSADAIKAAGEKYLSKVGGKNVLSACLK